jgi:hypothetical protein
VNLNINLVNLTLIKLRFFFLHLNTHHAVTTYRAVEVNSELHTITSLTTRKEPPVPIVACFANAGTVEAILLKPLHPLPP